MLQGVKFSQQIKILLHLEGRCLASMYVGISRGQR